MMGGICQEMMKHRWDKRMGDSWNTAGVVLILSAGLVSARCQRSKTRPGERKRQTAIFALPFKGLVTCR